MTKKKEATKTDAKATQPKKAAPKKAKEQPNLAVLLAEWKELDDQAKAYGELLASYDREKRAVAKKVAKLVIPKGEEKACIVFDGEAYCVDNFGGDYDAYMVQMPAKVVE